MGPVLLNTFINDLDDGAEQSRSNLAGDRNLGGVADSAGGHSATQKDLSRLEEWADRNHTEFSEGKCGVLHLDRNNPTPQYMLRDEWLKSTFAEKDLRVLVSLDDVLFKTQMQKCEIKQLECKNGESRRLKFNSLTRNYSSPVTGEKEMDLSCPHISLFLKDYNIHFSGAITYYPIKIPVEILISHFFNQNLLLKEYGLIRKVLTSSLDVFKPNFFSLFSLPRSAVGGTKLPYVVPLPYSDNTTKQLLSMHKL